MKKILFAVLFGAFLFCLSVSAQNLPKPTLTPRDPTPEQLQLIQSGVRLHDQGDYAAAVINYDLVLLENPTCVMAIYEKTLSLYYAKDYVKMVATALEGLKYKSNEIPLFYGLIANAYDDQGNPEKAIELYRQGIKMLEGDASFKPYLASLYYNLAVTYVGLKQSKEARINLKKAVPLNFSYASPHYLLSNVFYQDNYKIPAFLAASRLLSLEINTKRSQRAAQIIKSVMQGGVSQGKNPNEINIGVDFNAPKDEGDFDSLNLILGISKIGGDAKPGAESLTEEERFAEQVESVIGFMETESKIKSTFVGQNYLPFVIEMKRRKFVKPFAFLVMYHLGSQEAQNWLKSNNQSAAEFLAWAKNY